MRMATAARNVPAAAMLIARMGNCGASARFSRIVMTKPVVATTPRADAIDLDRFASESTAARIVVLAGSEGAGLSDAALKLADVAVRIPITSAVDSLNLAVAVGIVLSRLSAGAVSDKT